MVIVGDLIDPVWRVRQEWVPAEGGVLNVNTARWGILGFLELAEEWLDPSVPE